MIRVFATRVFRYGMLALALAAAASAEQPSDSSRRVLCSNASLMGAYAFSAKGTTLSTSPVPPALQGAFASGGTAYFDGKGGFTLTATSSFNGVIQPTTVKGVYSVNPDCTYTSQANNGVTFRAVIVQGGQELLILQTTPGVVITGLAERREAARATTPTRPNACIVTDGAYGFVAEGAAGPPTIPAPLSGPLAGVGTVAFQPNGSFVLTAQRSVNGVLDPEPLALKGKYSQPAEDCTFRMNFEVGFTFNASVANGGKEILFVETDPGTSLIVKATKI